jgi:hypothetical protein
MPGAGEVLQLRQVVVEDAVCRSQPLEVDEDQHRLDEDGAIINMGVWQGVAMDSLKFHPGPPCPTLLRPAGGPPLKRPHVCFRGGSPTVQTAGGLRPTKQRRNEL